ncbi:MAG TPA: hypothetical protein ENG83_05665 [Nitrospirae bacterium]|nr:hypothetical protein [Nitrospirota bacterium]
MAFVLANLFLIFSVIIFSVCLLAPLLGGKLSVSALIHFGSWIVLAIGIRIVSQRGRKAQKIRVYEYALICLAAIVNFNLWFTYPINIILSILIVVGTAVSYKAHNKRMKDDKFDGEI